MIINRGTEQLGGRNLAVPLTPGRGLPGKNMGLRDTKPATNRRGYIGVQFVNVIRVHRLKVITADK